MTTLKEWQAAKLKLELLGITVANYEEVLELLTTTTSMDLETVRAKQFSEQARDLCYGINAATAKNLIKVAEYLREFGEMIANELLPEKSVEEVALLLDDLVLPGKGEDQ